MAFKLANDVQETSTTTGTGTLTLAGAVAGFQPFSFKFANADKCFYTIFDSTGAYECGEGTYNANTLARNLVLESSNANNVVNWSAGTRNVLCGLPGSPLASLLDPAQPNGVLVRTAKNVYTAKALLGGAPGSAVGGFDSAAGYVKIAGTHVLMWGSGTVTAPGATGFAVALPITVVALQSVDVTWTLTGNTPITSYGAPIVGEKTTTSFHLKAYNADGATFNWIAIATI
jgi:hypothetical protein